MDSEGRENVYSDYKEKQHNFFFIIKYQSKTGHKRDLISIRARTFIYRSDDPVQNNLI